MVNCDNYSAEHSSIIKSRLLGEILKFTQNEHGERLISGPIVVGLLKLLINLVSARTILEIGTYTGYASVAMAECAVVEKVITCELNTNQAKVAQEFFEKSNVAYKIQLKVGRALDTIAGLDLTFDFIFIDADKKNYPDYYIKLLPKLSSGGVMVIDNSLWRGEVVNPNEPRAVAIDRTNKLIANDHRVFNLILPIKDGVNVVLKK